MTIKFFGLFFWQTLQLPPAAVSGLYVAGPLGIAACGLLAQRGAQSLHASNRRLVLDVTQARRVRVARHG